MVHDPFLAFMNLTLFDKEIVELKKQLDDYKVQIVKTQSEKNSIEESLKGAHDLVHQAKEMVDEKELDMKTLDSKEKEEKEKFDNVKNQKEYEAVKKEIEKISYEQHQKESELMNSWNRLETAKRDGEKIEEKNKEDIQLVEEKLKQLEASVLEAEKVCDTKIKERPGMLTHVPEELLEKYSIIQGQASDPVVVVDGDSCSACFYQIPHVDLMYLKRRKLLQCKSCYRFLYLEEFASKEYLSKKG